MLFYYFAECMMRLILFVALLGFTAAKSYEGYKVIDVTPNNRPQLEFLQKLLIQDVNVDFWLEPARLGQNVRIMLSGEHLQHSVSKQLAYHRLEYNVVNENVAETVREEQDRISAQKAKMNMAFDLDNFNNLTDIYDWLDTQNTNCPAALTCTYSTVGTTFEGRDIKAFTVTANPGSPKIYVDSTTHAREWITIATTLKVINNLLTNYGSDADVTNLLDTREWHFIPVVNPDGYDYSRTTNRYWRKNRAPNANSTCIGTDLNRNFDYNFGNNGVSFDPCSDIYCGTAGGSELETQTVQAYLDFVGSNNAYAAVTFHSYGYMWTFPWGFTEEPGNDNAPCVFVEDYDDQIAVASAVVGAIEATSGDDWIYGSGCETLYATTGSTDDYMKGGANIKYSFLPELRGDDFVIDAINIQPSFEEVWAGLVAMDAAIAARN